MTATERSFNLWPAPNGTARKMIVAMAACAGEGRFGKLTGSDLPGRTATRRHVVSMVRRLPGVCDSPNDATASGYLGRRALTAHGRRDQDGTPFQIRPEYSFGWAGSSQVRNTDRVPEVSCVAKGFGGAGYRRT